MLCFLFGLLAYFSLMPLLIYVLDSVSAIVVREYRSGGVGGVEVGWSRFAIHASLLVCICWIALRS